MHVKASGAGHSIPTLNSGIARAVDDPVLAYDLIPGWQGYIKGREISINSHGYRDADYAVGPKASNEFRIIGLGHSFAYASGVKAENGFFEQLTDILNERLSPTRFRVNNLAVPAESIPHWNRRLVRDGLAADPDLVLLSLTLDSSSVYPTENQVEKLKNSAAKNLALSGDSLYAFRKLLIARNNLAGKITSRLGRLQQMLLQPKASSHLPADPGPTLRDSLAEAAAIAAEAEVSFAVVSLRPMAFGSDSARYEPRNDMLRELCEEIGIRFIDTWDALPESGDLARFTVFPGDGHPNATGHAAYARTIADQLVQWVRELRASGS